MDGLVRKLHHLYAIAAAQVRSMSAAQRAAAALMVVVALVGIAWLARGGAVQHEYLLGGEAFAPSDLTAMAAALGKANLPFRIEGNRIEIPRGQQGACLGALADAGALPADFALILQKAVDDGGLWADGRQRDQRLKIATQKVLALTIRGMSGIENASVMYDVKTRPGISGGTIATASVTVKPAGSKPLDETRVRDIRHLVSSAVAELRPENVTVTDQNGRTYPGQPSDGSTPSSDAYYEMKRVYEAALRDKIVAALSMVPGAIPSVNVELDREISTVELTGDIRRVMAGLTPRRVAVSVAVPQAYFLQIWRSRHAGSGQNAGPDQDVLAQIEQEEGRKLQQYITTLLPQTTDGTDPLSLVTIKSFADPPPAEIIEPALGDGTGDWIGRGSVIGATLAVLASLVVLRSLIRHNPARTGARVGPPAARVVPAPHFLGSSRREELAALVRRDPEAAARLLRRWIDPVDAGAIQS
jgi:type III secretory pathway lipoprotein EscJ